MAKLMAAAGAAALLQISMVAAHAQLPVGWTAVADQGPVEEVRFEAMAPGWHLNPGKAALIYRPGEVVDASFKVHYAAHGFPDALGGYGVFFGGRTLEPATYDFFEIVLDGEGRFRLGHRAGSDYHEVVPWTPHHAIALPAAGSPAFNEVEIDVSPEWLAVRVNGDEVTGFEPPPYARFDGIVGLRVLDDANLHVTLFEVVDTP